MAITLQPKSVLDAVNPKSFHAKGQETEDNFAATFADLTAQDAQFSAGVVQASGTATLVAGAKTVATATAASGKIYLLTVHAVGGVQGWLRVANIVAATSFDILSSNAADTSQVDWAIFKVV